MTEGAGVDLYWLPLGAGGQVVRWSMRAYEAVGARLQRRPATDLYHSALRICLPEEWWVVEMTPVWAAGPDLDRGVVAQGAVGATWLGRSRWFRYEVHRTRRGTITDLAEAVGGPRRVSADEAVCRRLLAVLPHVPEPVWGRDELEAGEMWNSNSVVAWALSRSGIRAGDLRPPVGGSAPGWRAGTVVAGRQRVLRAV